MRRPGEINVRDGTDRALFVPPLFAAVLEAPGLGVAPHVGPAVSAGNIEEGDALERRALGQVQGNAITLRGGGGRERDRFRLKLPD